MTIDWKELKSAKPKTAPLFAIIFGPSGAGKSSALGTLGKSTLVLHAQVESHAATNARSNSVNPEAVIGLDYSMYNSENGLDADKTYQNLVSILKDPELVKSFEAVALDSWTELQSIIGRTAKFRDMCRTDKGTHNKFAETDSYLALLNEVVQALLNLHRQGMHIVTTCAALVKEASEDGTEISAKPSLLGFNVGEGLVRNFSDVLFVSLTRTEENKAEHKLIFNPVVGLVSKDQKGKVQKMSFANFSPRLSYFKREDLPDISDVDLSKIVSARDSKNQN